MVYNLIGLYMYFYTRHRHMGSRPSPLDHNIRLRIPDKRENNVSMLDILSKNILNLHSFADMHNSS